MLRSSFWRRLRVALMAGLFVGGASGAFCYWRPYERPEIAVYDLLAERTAPGRAPDEPVVLAAIDDASIEQVRRETDLGWPWPRELVGRGVEELSRLGARVVVLDQLYGDPSPAGFDDEAGLVRHLQAAGNVVLPGRVSEKDTLGNIPRGRWGARLGAFPSKAEALPVAARVCAVGLRPYLVSVEGGVELWLAGLRSKADAEGKARGWAGPGAPAPLVRELSAQEMGDPVEAEDWVQGRDPVEVRGAERLAVPAADAWTLPRPEVAAAAARVGIEPGTARGPLDGAEATSDADEVPDDDFDLPQPTGQRSVRLFVRKGGQLYPSLALAALLAAGPRELSVEGGRFRYGDQSVPVSRRGLVYVNYPRPGALAAPALNGPVPFGKLLENADRREHHLPTDARLEKAVKGKLVVVADLVSGTNLGPRRGPAASGFGGSAVVAATARTLLTGSAVGRASRVQDAEWALALGLFGALFAFFVFRGARSLLLTLGLGVGGIGLALFVFFGYAVQRFTDDRVWVAVFWPGLAFGLAAVGTAWINFGEEANDRSRVLEALGRLTSPAIIDRVLLNPGLLAPERRVLSVYFSDLVGFGGLAESLPARRLAELLGTYFGAMGDEVLGHRGHVDKYVGDAVMAVWNAPLKLDHHPLHAARAALAMRDRLEKLRPSLLKEFGAELRAQAALHTGEAVVGDLGGRAKRGEKANYTAVGPAVALCARLVEANRLYGTELLCTQAIVDAVGEAVVAREVDQVRLPGAKEPVRIYELQAEKGKLDDAQKECNRHYAKGLAAYRERAFAKAGEHFRDALAARPGDGPAKAMLERCGAYRDQAPAADWDGSLLLQA